MSSQEPAVVNQMGSKLDSCSNSWDKEVLVTFFRDLSYKQSMWVSFAFSVRYYILSSS